MERLPLLIPRIRRRKVSQPPPGAPPGALSLSPDRPVPRIQRFVYDDHTCQKEDVAIENLEAAFRPVPGRRVWVDVQGLGSPTLMQRLADALALHPLTIEDIVHVNQRPKLEVFDEYLLLVFRAIRLSTDGELDNDQISMVLRPDLLATFQEHLGDGFDPIRQRLLSGHGHLRRGGLDLLMATLLDVSVDDYFPVIDLYQESMDQLEDDLLAEPAHVASRTIHMLRRELRLLRRAVWPLRDLAMLLERGGLAPITAEAAPTLRDCHDHVVQVADFVEGARERATDLSSLHLAMLGERTNQVMKVLTMIATLFIPLTFLCGLYGMNFDRTSPFNMPELGWRYGYLAFWATIVLISSAMLLFFYRKGWLRRGP